MINLDVAFPLDVLEKLKTGIYIYQEGKFVFVNAEIERISGYSREELFEINPFDLLVEEMDKENISLFTEMVFSNNFGELPERYIAKIRKKDGTTAWVEMRAFPAVFKGKKAIVCNVIDITDLKQEEEVKRMIEKYADFSNKMIRHDLANKISAAMNLIEISLEKHGDEVLKKAYAVLLDSAKTLKRLRNLESLIKTGGELEEISVKEVFQEVSKNYSLNVKILGDVTVLADDGLYSIADNLLNNAVKHGKSKNVRVVMSEEDEGTVVRIEDDGVGISDEVKERIFNEGFHVGKGQGLGLFIVASLMERYGGSVEVRDNEPQGTVFVLRFCGR